MHADNLKVGNLYMVSKSAAYSGLFVLTKGTSFHATKDTFLPSGAALLFLGFAKINDQKLAEFLYKKKVVLEILERLSFYTPYVINDVQDQT